MRLLLPIRVLALITTWEAICVPAPISTPGPITLHGPTVTSSASLAPGSMMARESINFHLPFCAHDGGFADQLIAHRSTAGELVDTTTVGDDGGLQLELVTRHHGPLQAHVIGTDEVIQVAILRLLLLALEAKHTGS